MLDVLLAIRNNNVRKIPSYDPETAEHRRKLLRNYVRDASDRQLRISLADLMNSESKGRWWIVGSAWAGADPACAGTPDTDAGRPRGISCFLTPDESFLRAI